MANSYSIQQSVGGTNGAVAGTTVAATLAATQYRSHLLAVVGCGVAGAVITMPAGWVLIGNLSGTNPAGGTFGVYFYQGNPGGITTVTATITSSLASIIIFELIGGYTDVVPTMVDIIAQQSNSNSANWGTGAQPNFQSLNDLTLLVVGYMNPTSLTATYPNTFNELVNAIGSAAAGNVGLRAAANLSVGKSNQNVGGLTLSGVPANGPVTMYVALLFSPIIASNYFNGPQNYIVSN